MKNIHLLKYKTLFNNHISHTGIIYDVFDEYDYDSIAFVLRNKHDLIIPAINYKTVFLELYHKIKYYIK